MGTLPKNVCFFGNAFRKSLGVNLDNVCFNDVKIYETWILMHFVKFPAKWHYKDVEKATVLVVLLQGATTYYALLYYLHESSLLKSTCKGIKDNRGHVEILLRHNLFDPATKNLKFSALCQLKAQF